MRLRELFTGVGRKDFLFSLGSIAFAGGIVLGTVIAGDTNGLTAVPEPQTIEPAPPTGTTLPTSTTRTRAPRTVPETTRGQNRGTAVETSRVAPKPTAQQPPPTTGRQPPPSTNSTLPPTSTTRCKVRVSISTLLICVRVSP